MASVLKTEKTEDGASYLIDFGNGVKLWFDVWEDEGGEVTGDWNQYIFNTYNKEDMDIKAFQEAHSDGAGAYNFATALDLASEAYKSNK